MKISRGKSPPRVGDQLELELAGPGRAWYEPWGGRSPRVLTKAVNSFSLGALPLAGLRGNDLLAGLHEDNASADIQLELPFGEAVYDGR